MAISAGSIQLALGLEAKGFNSGMSSASKAVNQFVGGVQSAGQKTSAFQKSLVGVGAAVTAAGFSFIKMSQASFKVAASVAEMNVAMDAVGKSTGIGGQKIKDTAKEIRSMGIEMQASQEIAMLFVKGNIELSKASQVARVAQDLAVLSQSNSTDTARTLTYAIQTGNSQLLKSAGITKYASEAYAMYARELKVTESSLTATQRQMAITNMIIKEGAKVAGVYEAAMQEPGKVLRSFPRLLNDIQLEFGNVYLKGFGPAILAAYKLTDAFSKSIRSGGAFAPVLQAMGKAFEILMKPIADTIKNLTLMYQRIPKLTFNVDAMAKSMARLAPILTSGSVALSMFAGTRLLSAIPILQKFIKPIAMGGPLIGGLSILIAMSPKLRGVFLEVASALKPLVPAFLQIGESAGKIFLSLMSAVENIATALQGSLVASVTGLSVAFLGVAKVIAPVVENIAVLIEHITRSAFVVQSLAAFLIAKLVVGFVATNTAMIAFRTTMASTIAQAKVMQFQFATTFANMRALGVSTFASIRMASTGAFGSIVAGAKTAGIAIATSLGPLVLLTIAITVAMKVFSAWSNRNKDVEATTKGVTEAVKEQTKSLKGNEQGIRSYLGNASLIDDILLSAEGSGDKLSESMMILTGSTKGASEMLAKMQSDSKATTEAIGAQSIGTDELSKKTIAYINNVDKTSVEDMTKALKNGFGVYENGVYVIKQLTDSQIQAALALEELQDQAENTSFAGMREAIAKTVMATSNYGASAVRTADELTKLAEKNKKFASDYEKNKFYVIELNKALAEQAEKNGEVATSIDGVAIHNYATEIGALTLKLAEGDVTADMYSKALFGTHDATNILNKSLHESQKSFGDLLKGMKDSKGSTIKLKDAGYALMEQMVANQKILTENGGTTKDTVEMEKTMVAQFIESAKAAGYKKDAVEALIRSLGIYDSMGNIEVTLQLNIDEAIKAFQAYLKMFGAVADRLDKRDGATSKLNELNNAIAEAQRLSKESGKFGNDSFKGISDSAKNASKNTATLKDATEALTERIKKQKRAVVEAKQALQDYARASTESMYKSVGVSEVYNRFFASQEKIKAQTERNSQIRAQMEADRVSKERANAELLVDSKNKLIDAENELLQIQIDFAQALGSSVSSVLSFSDVLGRQTDAVNELTGARENQATAEVNLADKQNVRTAALAKVALLEGQIANTAGRYQKRLLGDELVKAQEDAVKATLEFADAQEVARLAVEATNTAGTHQITFLKGLEEQASKSLNFASVIEKLSAQGLSNDALSQIASAGADAGTVMGNELIAGGADAITKANKFVKTIVDEGKRIADKFTVSLKSRLEYAIYDDKPVYEALGIEVGETFAESLKKQSDKAKDFAVLVKRLIAAGLRGTQLEEVLNAGVDAGTDIANALLGASEGTIAESVAIQDELKNLSKKFGDELVPYFDQTGIMLADALLSALKKKLVDLPKILKGKSGEEINDFIENLDDSIADTNRIIADTLVGTPVPAPVVSPIATMTVPSAFGGSMSNVAEQTAVSKGYITQDQADALFARRAIPFADGGIVKSKTFATIGEAGPEAVIPLDRLGSMGGATYEITVNAGMGANGTSIGAQIVEQIKRYEKSNGKRWRS